MLYKVPLSAFLVIVFGGYIEVYSLRINATSELYRSRRQTSCRRSEYTCKSGQCISSYDKCDGVTQCADGSDETAAACKAPGVECPLLSFQCEYGACIYERLRCDNKADCADGSDEKGCPGAYGSSSSTPSCSKYEFKCTNGQCITGYDICDGIKHCLDGSDESNDVCWDYECPSRSFKCAYGACVDPSLRCNGKEDCFDGSDEQGCPKANPTTKANRPTSKYEIQCTNGQYISGLNICDGIKHCLDGSDESKEVCWAYESQRPPTTRPPPPPTTRPTTTTSTTTESPPDISDPTSCKLPQHPKNGAYNAQTNQCIFNSPRLECRNTPGVYVPSNWVLKYSCNTGYSFNKDSVHSICEYGVWSNPVDCIKLCPPLKSLSVDVKCYYAGVEVNCTQPMKPDTRATARCKPNYKQASLPEYSSLACLRNGDWSYRLFYCTPECGLSSKIEDKSKTSVPLISNGTPAKVGEFPWLAAIYRKTAQYWDQQCGGTLITTHIVVTAAHCLVDNNVENRPVHPSEVKVGLGKYYRDYYVQEGSSIMADVREVLIPPEFSGQASQYAQDIGLLDLVVSVQVTAVVMPACIDWTTNFEPASNAEGVVAGWGRTSDGGESSEFILSARLKLIKYGDCLKRLSPGIRLLLSHDKFCSGDVDGSQVNKGDSGGGLTFLKDKKYFLIGVVSSKIPGFSTFVDVSNKEHSTWLEREKTRLKLIHGE